MLLGCLATKAAQATPRGLGKSPFHVASCQYRYRNTLSCRPRTTLMFMTMGWHLRCLFSLLFTYISYWLYRRAYYSHKANFAGWPHRCSLSQLTIIYRHEHHSRIITTTIYIRQ